MKLTNIILEELYKFDQQAKKLEAELKDTYNRDDIYVTLGQYSGKDRGFGKVTFKTQDELPGSEWQNVKNVITAKGYEITQDSNYFDQDKDRAWYPSIKFEFDI